MALPSRPVKSEESNVPQEESKIIRAVSVATSKTAENENKLNNVKSIMRKFREDKKIATGSYDEVRSLTYEAVKAAPDDFYTRYEGIVKILTDLIQTSLSNSGKAGLIAKLKTNPTDTDYIKDAFYAINAEFLKYDGREVKDKRYTMLDDDEKRIVLIMVVNEICGLGPLEPLFRDFSIREIICNGPKDIQVEISGAIREVPAVKFRDAEHLENLIGRLYKSVNKEISKTRPMERARLHDNSRIFAVDQSVALGGPTLNIRRHTDEWVSPETIIGFGTVSEELMYWLGAHINAGLNFLVVGGTATGKTTLLGALTAFYRNDARILTVERNIEMKGCPTKLWGVPMEVLPARSEYKGVSMRDLVEATTQMRPDGIIVGETTGDECWDLLQALNTGHFGASTIHANSSEEGIYRAQSLAAQADLVKGEALYNYISSAFDMVINIQRSTIDGARIVYDVSEVGTECTKGEDGIVKLPVHPIWKFIENKDSDVIGKTTGEWVKVGELSDKRKKKHKLDTRKLISPEKLKELYPAGV